MLKYKNEGKNHMKKIYNILTICLLTFVLPSYAFAYDATEEITCDSGVLQSDSAATVPAEPFAGDTFSDRSDRSWHRNSCSNGPENNTWPSPQ